jgi:hypothetical protein
MQTYQTYLYRARLLNKKFGWDYDVILFASPIFDNATDAMMAFNNNPISVKNWIGTIQEFQDGKLIDEEIFDSTVLKEA